MLNYISPDKTTQIKMSFQLWPLWYFIGKLDCQSHNVKNLFITT